MKTRWITSGILALILGPPTWAASIEDVTFLTRIQVYETVADTTLITQEGKRIPLDKGTKVNVAGFTATEALIVSRSDRPNAFVKKADIVPITGANVSEPPHIKEETLPPSGQGAQGVTR
jgi:hypothetical protein